ncbi:MAG TPA: hypothetical protein VIF02_09470 [Methylocella sp.]
MATVGKDPAGIGAATLGVAAMAGAAAMVGTAGAAAGVAMAGMAGAGTAGAGMAGADMAEAGMAGADTAEAGMEGAEDIAGNRIGMPALQLISVKQKNLVKQGIKNVIGFQRNSDHVFPGRLSAGRMLMTQMKDCAVAVISRCGLIVCRQG